MKSTFSVRQELRSLEFGTLLYEVVPKGVYVAPSLTVTGSGVTMSGGTFLFYDNTGNIEHAVRISFDDTETIGTSTGAPSAGQYLSIEFSYNVNAANAPSLVLSSSRPDTSNNSKQILLGVIRSNGSGLFVDTTDMEMRGPSYSYPSPGISSLSYDSTTGQLVVNFAGYFQTNGSLTLIDQLSTTGINKANAYQIYIDQTGTAQVRQTPSTETNMGKNILAYKTAGADTFIIIPYSNRAEITSDSLTLSSVSLTQNTNTLNSIYTSSETVNPVGEAVLSKVVQRLVTEVQALRRELGAKTDTAGSDTVYGRLKHVENSTGGLGDTIETKNLIVTNKTDIKGEVNFTDATLTFDNTDFGSENKPLNKLFVEDVLYATSLEYFSY